MNGNPNFKELYNFFYDGAVEFFYEKGIIEFYKDQGSNRNQGCSYFSSSMFSQCLLLLSKYQICMDNFQSGQRSVDILFLERFFSIIFTGEHILICMKIHSSQELQFSVTQKCTVNLITLYFRTYSQNYFRGLLRSFLGSPD